MNFIKTVFENVYIIEKKPFHDDRGMFTRSFCAEEFKQHNLPSNMVQTNLSITKKKHTLRGMHYQVAPYAEDKLVQCIKGSILDVILDIREGSTTFGKYMSVELSEVNNRMLLVPKGFAHGFLTLEDNCYVQYQVSNYYNPESERGIKWNDTYFNITWPCLTPNLSNKDASWKQYNS